MKSNLFSSVIIKIDKKDLIKINNIFTYKVKIYKQDKDNFYLQIKEEDISRIENQGINFELITYIGIKRVLRLLVTHLSVLIGVIIFFIIVYLNTLTIKEITFSAYTKDNNKIKKIIESYFTSVYGIDFFSGDVNEINLLLRKEFSHFEWISINKIGSRIHVTVLEPSIINKQVEKVDGFGDLVAKKDGMIKSYQVKHGIVLIEQNQFVRKGQVLVSGNLRYNNYDESTFYIPAEGKVYAEVWYTEKITVPKKIVATEYTGKIKSEKSFSLFGLDIKYKGSSDKYKKYDKETDYDYLKFFSFELPIGIKKVHYLEKDDIINIYDKDTAYEYAISKINRNISNFFREGDKILTIDLLDLQENDSEFVFTFFVRTHEDIAQFQRRFMDE